MALPRVVTSLSTAPVSQDRMPSPAADWYTVMVTGPGPWRVEQRPRRCCSPRGRPYRCTAGRRRSRTARPCRSCRTGWLAGAAGAGRGRIRGVDPAGGWAPGVGTDGWQMLFRSPTMPLDPAAQNPNRPPMSPIPATEQIPPDGAAGCAGTWTAVVVTALAGSSARAGLTAAWATAGMPSTAATATSQQHRTPGRAGGTAANARIWRPGARTSGTSGTAGTSGRRRHIRVSGPRGVG